MAFVSIMESVKRAGQLGHLIILTNLLLHVFVVAGCNMKLSEGSGKKSANNSVSLAEYLTKNYDKAVRPDCATGKPLEVYMDLYVESFGNIEEANMEFPVFIYLRQLWKDDRFAKLVDSTVNLQRELITKLWSPDAHCYNAKQSNLMLPDTEVHSLVKLEPDGSILYSRSAHIVASCEMDLHNFPVDEQICKLTFGSYALADNDIVLKWKNSKIKIANKEMAQFTVGEPTLSTKANSFSTGNYTTLTVSFPFKRRMGYYVIQVYIPCIFLVMLSWIVFWMKPDDSSSRLTVGITTILTIVFLLGYTNSTLPKVSYVKGMDWYLMVCFAIIFMSLLECVIVDKLWRMNAKDKEKKNSTKTPSRKCTSKKRGTPSYRNVPWVQIYRPKKTDSCQLRQEDANQYQAEEEEQDRASQMSAQEYNHLGVELNLMSPPSATESCVESGKSCPLELSAKVDYASRILFPLTFTLYNVAYWISYLYGISILPNRSS